LGAEVGEAESNMVVSPNAETDQYGKYDQAQDEFQVLHTFSVLKMVSFFSEQRRW
jgi:hypothetical protein